MKLKYLFFALILALFTPKLGARDFEPLTQAVMDGYAQILEANPQDYLTLNARAMQYYQLSMYDEALVDLQNAIRYTPVNDKEDLASSHYLISAIKVEQKDFEAALAAIDNALACVPNDYRYLEMKGNIQLDLNRPDQAIISFQAMQRLNTRSQAALFGLAAAAIQQGRKDDARALMKNAEAMDPTNYLTYCRLGDLHRQLGENEAAATDYISAFTLTSKSNRPLEALLELAKADYPAVDSAVGYALTKTGNILPLYFVRGNAALQAGRLDDAYQTYRKLISLTDAGNADILTTMAEICLRRGEIDEAREYVDKALQIDGSNADALELREKLQQTKA